MQIIAFRQGCAKGSPPHVESIGGSNGSPFAARRMTNDQLLGRFRDHFAVPMLPRAARKKLITMSMSSMLRLPLRRVSSSSGGRNEWLRFVYPRERVEAEFITLARGHAAINTFESQ